MSGLKLLSMCMSRMLWSDSLNACIKDGRGEMKVEPDIVDTSICSALKVCENTGLEEEQKNTKAIGNDMKPEPTAAEHIESPTNNSTPAHIHLTRSDSENNEHDDDHVENGNVVDTIIEEDAEIEGAYHEDAESENNEDELKKSDLDSPNCS